MKTKKYFKKISENTNQFFKNINKINKPLARFIFFLKSGREGPNSVKSADSQVPQSSISLYTSLDTRNCRLYSSEHIFFFLNLHVSRSSIQSLVQVSPVHLYTSISINLLIYHLSEISCK